MYVHLLIVTSAPCTVVFHGFMEEKGLFSFKGTVSVDINDLFSVNNVEDIIVFLGLKLIYSDNFYNLWNWKLVSHN